MMGCVHAWARVGSVLSSMRFEFQWNRWLCIRNESADFRPITQEDWRLNIDSRRQNKEHLWWKNYNEFMRLYCLTCVQRGVSIRLTIWTNEPRIRGPSCLRSEEIVWRSSFWLWAGFIQHRNLNISQTYIMFKFWIIMYYFECGAREFTCVTPIMCARARASFGLPKNSFRTPKMNK